MTTPNDQGASAYLQPLRDQMRVVEQAIIKRETELSKLRNERSRLSRALTALDPVWAAGQRKTTRNRVGQTNKRADGSYAISADKLERTLDYIREHYPDGGTFTARDLSLEVLGFSTATRGQALNALHDLGRIRLDKVLKRGGAKVYTLNQAGDSSQ